MSNAETKCPPSGKTRVHSKNVKQLSLTVMPAPNAMEAGGKISVVFIEIITNKKMCIITAGPKCSDCSLRLHYFCKVLCLEPCHWEISQQFIRLLSYFAWLKRERKSRVEKSGVVAVIAVSLQTHEVQSQAVT